MKIFRIGIAVKIFLTFLVSSAILFGGMGYFLIQNKTNELNSNLTGKGALLSRSLGRGTRRRYDRCLYRFNDFWR